MLRLGLLLSTTTSAAASACRLPRTLDLRADPAGAPLKPGAFSKGFEYSDCWVEDSRLVALNARDAADRGAHRPHPDAGGGGRAVRPKAGR